MCEIWRYLFYLDYSSSSSSSSSSDQRAWIYIHRYPQLPAAPLVNCQFSILLLSTPVSYHWGHLSTLIPVGCWCDRFSCCTVARNWIMSSVDFYSLLLFIVYALRTKLADSWPQFAPEFLFPCSFALLLFQATQVTADTLWIENR